jgi:hypothetical protein
VPEFQVMRPVDLHETFRPIMLCLVAGAPRALLIDANVTYADVTLFIVLEEITLIPKFSCKFSTLGYETLRSLELLNDFSSWASFSLHLKVEDNLPTARICRNDEIAALTLSV